MANFDTQAKRFSGMGIDLPWSMILPKPTGTVTQAEQQSLVRKYAGILFTFNPEQGFDTQPKRYSGFGMDLPWSMMLPKPTGTVTQPEQQNLVRKYAGILFAGGATTSIRDLIMVGFIPFPRT